MRREKTDRRKYLYRIFVGREEQFYTFRGRICSCPNTFGDRSRTGGRLSADADVLVEGGMEGERDVITSRDGSDGES
jgi:hypothetical protein